MGRSEITEADKQFIAENYGVLLSHEIPVKLGLQRRVYFRYVKSLDIKNNRQKRGREEKPEYHFSWRWAVQKDFIFGNTQQ